MRTKNELLQLILDNQHLFKDGLCYWIKCMYKNKIIKENERDFLLGLINRSLPINILFEYYWKVGEIEPRIEWIKKQMES